MFLVLRGYSKNKRNDFRAFSISGPRDYESYHTAISGILERKGEVGQRNRGTTEAAVKDEARENLTNS